MMSMAYQEELTVTTRGRSMMDITQLIERRVAQSGIQTGLCLVFVKHTSASLLLSENCDRDVCVDLERFMSDLSPDGDERFVRTAEGPDDMPAHVRSVLTGNSHSMPITDGMLNLGIWQGIFLWGHRQRAHSRIVNITIVGV